MKAYKLEVLIIDREGMGADDVVNELVNTRYNNDCIMPEVMKVEEADIGEWHDDHPLNFKDTTKSEYERLFPAN